jgi:hypothetical protein
LAGPEKMKFEHFTRTRDGREEEVKSVVISNTAESYIMLKEEITLKKPGTSTSVFFAACSNEN